LEGITTIKPTITGTTKLEEVKKAVSNKGQYGKAYILRFFSDIARLRMVVGISAAIANSTASL
jgi:hypothetical protein